MALLTPPTAADTCRLFKLTPPAAALLRPDHTPAGFFDRLVADGHLADARRLLAHALPPQRAVWWAALCLHHSRGRKPFATPAEDAAFDAAARWCAAPSDAARRAAGDAGWAAKPTTAAGTLAMAAFLSGGSMSLPGLPAVLPKPHLCGRLAGVAVYLASVRFDPAHYKRHLRDYLAIGRDVARGLLLTPVPDPVPVDAPTPADAAATAPGLDPALAERLAAFLKAAAQGGQA